MKIKRLLALGLAGLGLTASLPADVTVVITGGNASKNVLFDRAAALLVGATVQNGPNSNTRSYKTGTITGSPGLGLVTIHFAQNGATLGLQNLRDQVNVTTAVGPLPPQLAVSGNFPETAGINGSIFTSARTLVVPFVFVKNPALPNSLNGVNNLTQRQAALLEAVSGLLPTAFFGGESTTDPLYLVGRNTGAAVRQVIDANIYFSGAPTFWTTNVANNPPNPPLQDFAGRAAGQEVINVLSVVSNAIGTVSSQDVGSFTPLSYEGVPFTDANVKNGSYPIWGYEAWYYKTSGSGAPSANQLAVINALYSAVTDNTYQHTPGNAFATAKFVPLADLQVERSADGGPITSTIY